MSTLAGVRFSRAEMDSVVGFPPAAPLSLSLSDVDDVFSRCKSFIAPVTSEAQHASLPAFNLSAPFCVSLFVFPAFRRLAIHSPGMRAPSHRQEFEVGSARVSGCPREQQGREPGGDSIVR